MTERRDAEARLGLYDELRGILGAMRGIALAELLRVERHEPAQQRTCAALADTYAALAAALPEPPPPPTDTWILLGSVRGFCASFNEDVLRRWQAQATDAAATVVVGERLQSLLGAGGAILPVAGAVSVNEALPAIERLLDALAHIGPGHGLMVCFRGEEGAVVQRVLPLPVPSANRYDPPITNEPARQVAAGVGRHLLFYRLLGLLVQSLHVENHMRLMQMENALNHIDRATEVLLGRRNHLRQEEIVEEIESIPGQRNKGIPAASCPDAQSLSRNE